MARRKVNNVERAAIVGARAAVAAAKDVELILTDEDENEDEDPIAALSEIGGDTSGNQYVVTCMKPYDKAGRVMKVAREELPTLADRLTDEFGPGTYKVHALDSSNRYVHGRQLMITISPMARRSDKTPATPETAVLAGTSPSPAAVPDYLREMEARNERMRLEAREDRREFRTLLATLLGPAVPRLLELFLGRQPTMVEQINMLGGLKALAGGGDTDKAADKMLDVFSRGMELAQEMAGGGQQPGGWPGVISEGLKIAGTLAQRQPATPAAVAALPAPSSSAPAPVPLQPAGGAPAAAPAGGGGGAISVPAAAVSLPEPWGQFEPLLRDIAKEVDTYAKNDIQPAMAVGALLQKIPDNAAEVIPPPVLIPLLERPDWWQHVVTFAPDLQGRYKYCDQIRQLVLQAIRQAFSQSEDVTTGEAETPANG